MARCRHRIDYYWCFLSLELIHGPDARTRQSLLQLENLCVVWSDDQEVVEHNRGLSAKSIDPRCARCQYFSDKIPDGIGLFRRGALIARVLDCVGSSPEEGSASTDCTSGAAQGIESSFIFCRELQSWKIILLVGHLLNTVDWQAFTGCRDNHFVEKVADDFVTVCRNADPLAVTREGADHASAGVCLSRSRRALDRKNALVQIESDPHSSCQRRLAIALKRFPPKSRCDFHPIVGDVFSEPKKGLRLLIVVIRLRDGRELLMISCSNPTNDGV